MAKVALINWYDDPGINTWVPEIITKSTGTFPPLGISYIAAVLKKSGHEVSFLDVNAEGWSIDEYRERIRRIDPHVVGFTSTTGDWLSVLEGIKITKDVLPRTITIVGGPQLTMFPEESISFDTIDIGVIGEGEYTMVELMDRLEDGKDFTDIRGISYKKNGTIYVAPKRDVIMNLDTLPFPARELLPNYKYNAILADNPLVTMISSRGCPYSCTFCCKETLGKTFRQRSPENIIQEIEHIIANYTFGEIMMFDETFTLNKKTTLAICRLINEKRLKFKWSVRTRVDRVDEESLQALKDAGCIRLHLGVESGNSRILEKMNKKIALEQIEKCFKIVNNIGFETMAYLMIGFPGEDRQSVDDTINFTIKIKPSWINISVVVPYPKTHLYQLALNDGLINYDYWREYTLGRTNGIPLHFTNEHLDENTLTRLHKDFYKRFYLRPSFILNKLLSVKSPSKFFSYIKGFVALSRL